MRVEEAIIAEVNGKLGRTALYRALLEHKDWRVVRPTGVEAPTIIFADTAQTPAIWTFSSDEAYRAACHHYTEEGVGAVSVVGSLAKIIADLDPRISCWCIDPSSRIALRILHDMLPLVRKIARGMLLEVAITEGRYSAARGFDAYVVPYFGVLGQGHQVITLPSDKGNMIAAFTASDTVDAFLATGSDEDRHRVNLIEVDGATLFGEVAAMASGILLNAAGPHTFGFDLAMCRSIAAAAEQP
jgi:hypothetical protein